MAFVLAARAAALPVGFEPPPGPRVEPSDAAEALARPPRVEAAEESPECVEAAPSGARLAGGGAPPEPPPEPAVVVALERVGALAAPDVFTFVVPDVGEVVPVWVVVACDVETVVAGTGVDGALVLTVGAGDVVTETDVEGSGEVVPAVTPVGVVETSAVTGPTVASTGVGETVGVTVGTRPADACAAAITNAVHDAQSHTKPNRERARSERREIVRFNILIETPTSRSLTKSQHPWPSLAIGLYTHDCPAHVCGDGLPQCATA